jgi:hypothetical protein
VKSAGHAHTYVTTTVTKQEKEEGRCAGGATAPSAYSKTVPRH